MKTFANIQKEIISHLKSSARSAQGLLYSFGLVVTLLLIGIGNVWGATVDKQATWTFSSSSYPSNNTNFNATGGEYKTGSYFKITNSSTGWNASKSAFKFTCSSSAPNFFIAIKTPAAIPSGTKITLKATMWYNKSSNKPLNSAAITVSTNGGSSYSNTGLGTKTWTLSNSSAEYSTIYTTQANIAANTVIVFKLAGASRSGAGEGYCMSPSITIPVESGSTYTFHLMLPHGDGTFTQYDVTDKSLLGSSHYSDIVCKYKACYGSAAFWDGNWTNYWCPTKTNFADRTTSAGTRYNSSTSFPISSETEITLYPQFAYGSGTSYYHTDPHCPSYHVTYDGNGKTSGTVPSDAKDYDGGETVTVKSATLTKTNYTFTGWNTESDGSGTHYAASGSETFTITEDVTLYAEWCRDLSTLSSSDISIGGTKTGTSATITWSAPGATKCQIAIADNATWASATYQYQADNVTSSSISRTDLTPGTTYYVQIRVKNDCGSTYKDKSFTFTTKNAYVITYNKNDGSGTSATESKTEGVNYTISSDKFSRDGYTLSKWNTQAGGGGTDYEKGATYSDDAPLDLYAVWTANNYTITLDKNGGSGGPASVSATYGSAAPSVGTLPTKADQNFAGYWTGEGGTGTMVVDASGVWVAGISGYTDGSKNWIGTEDKTIYAKWVDKTYTNYRTTCSETYDIVLHDNNGGSHNGSAKVADGGKLLTNIIAPTRDGYSVEGYYAEAGTSTKIADASGALQSDKTGYTDATGAWTKGEGATLYAKWTATNYTITYDGLEGASNSNPTSYNIATPTITLVAPGSREGYTFAGWTCGGSPITQIAVGSTGDKTITATWTANTYTVQFNANGGGGSMSPQNFTYGEAQSLTSNGFTAPSEKSFGGWTTNSDGTGDFYTNGQSVSNLTSVNGATVDLYAKWVDCDLYTMTLNVNGDTWKTVTQGSCGASIDLSGFTDVPNCGGGYTLRGWSTTNSATPMFDAPTITTSSTYTPESDVTLYAVYSHSAVVGTRVMSTASLSESEYYYVVASGYNKVMAQPTSTTNLAATIDVAKSADGSKCVVTGSGTPLEIMLTNKTSSWMISKYNSSTGNNWYYYSQSSRNALAWYDEDDYWEWWYEDDIEKYGDWYDAESYVYTNTPSSRWTISIDGSTGVATISETTNSRTWKYNSSDDKFGAYTSGNKPVSLYQIDESGLIYTTQPDMTVYTITKGVESNGTFTIAEGVACSGQAVAVSATPASGYAFSGWTSSTGGSFGNASSATTTFTPTANTTVTANFVAATPHDITWMVNGTAYTTGEPTSSLTAGTSFSTMTLPTAPANNTLSSACGAVANQFVGWSTTDMGFATGQSAPAKLFTTAAGAGSAYGNMGDEDVTFYAVFAQDGSSNYMSRCPNTYTITLDDNGDYGGNGSATATEKGTSLTINSTPTRLGYSVEGYYKEVGTTTKVATDAGALQNGSGSGIDGWTNSSSQFIGTSDGTLYTKWNIVTYNLTYENLNGASNSNPATYQVTTATIVLADPGSRTGYTFAGWTCGGDAITQIALGSTGDKTITANWTANKYNITYKDKDDAAYSGDKTDGRPTGLPAQHTYGSATELNDGTRTGYRFDGWYTSSNCSTGKVTSLGATDYTSAITLYAKWTASHTYSFSKNGVIDGTLQKGAVEGETVTMPNTTVDCGLWTTFVGWVEGDVAETTTEPATIYRAGDIYEVPLSSGDKTFKAVYSKHEGDATVSYVKVASNSVTPSGEYVIASPDGNTILTGLNANNRGTKESVTISDNVISNKGNGAILNVNKKGSKFNIKISGDTKYITTCNDTYFEHSVTDAANACMWELTSDGYIHSTDHTTRYIEYLKSGTQYFGAYTGTQWKAYLYRKRVAGTTYYTTAPGSCEVPTKITVSYNDNKANAGDQTISGMPSGTTLTFTDYPDFDTYTVGSAPTDPTGYHFVGWNTSVDGSGDSYTAGASVTTFGYTETITLYAQWERVYTVTLMDNGVERTRLTQASAGANVTLPSGNNCTPGSAFTFVGWTDSPVQLNAEPVRPNIVSGAGEWGDDELTDDITLYSVYSKSVAGCDDFAAGVSGAYKLTDKASGEYALAAGGTSSSYARGSSGDAEIFYIGYSPAKSAYTIRTSTGYLGWFGLSGSEALTKGNTTPYYWNITAGTGANSGYWYFEPVGISGRQFSGNSSSKFQLHGNSTKYYIQLTKMAMTYYYNTASCGDNSITFHDGGGSISGTPTTPTGASWNSGTHILSGLEDCDKITEFPTASYDGWTFIGWSTEDYSNNGKHTTDYVEENASTDEPDGSGIYKTDGNPYVVRGGSIDMYPIFTRFPENEPFNTTSGGDYYIYYLEPGSNDGYGALVRQYAGEYDNVKRYGRTTSCAAATEFTFTKDGDVWHIYDKTKGKYVTGKTSDDWLVLALDLSGSYDDWTITIRSGNQFDATCGVGGGRQLSFSTSANYFMNYELAATPGYPPVYLGTCTERIFSSEPNPTPTVDLTGEPMVTSSKGQTVRAAIPMTLSASHITGTSPLKVTITGTNLKFATSAAVNTDPAASLEVAVDGSGKIDPTTIYVYYTPTEDEDGIENITVNAVATKWGPTEIKRTTGIVHARHLPEDFVIATKLGDKWYALPANCTTNSSSIEGMLIEVDDVNDPTAATAAPASTKYGLRNVAPKTRKAGNGERMVFTERISTATADNQMTLYNGSSTNIQVNAMYTTYKDNDTEATRKKYEWTPETSDFKDYLLTSASASRTLSMNTSGVFGSLTKDKAYSGQVRLLPATFYTPADMQVVEWKANSVVVMYTGSGVTATTKVGTNSESSAQTLTTAKVDHGVFELTTNQALTSNANTQLLITIKNGSSAVVGKKALVIPAIINTDNKTADYVVSGADAAERIAKAATTDVVILDGAVLSAVATKYTYKNITVYPGGKLVIGSGNQLGMASLTLRGGSSWGAASYEHKYPQFVVNNATDGAYSNTAVKINYDYVTTKAQYYTFVLPYTGNTSTIKYPVDIYGKNLDSGSQASFEFQYYDGEARAAGGTGWATLAEPADLVAGRGYTFLGMPRKVDAYDGTDNSHSNTRQTYGIHRIPMSVSASTVQSGETNSSPGKSTPISVTLADKNNASGWVLVGNPFMGDVTGLSNEDIQVGELVHTSTVPWDGKWEWDDTNPSTGVRYVVIPYNSGTDYHSEMAEDAELPAFKNFFVQIKNGSATSLVIPASSRNDAGLAPARYVAQEVKDIRLAVDLVSDTKSDKVDFLINDTYSAAYDDDADFTKMMNGTNFNLYGVYPGDNLSFIAVDKTTAAGNIAIGYQVPAASEYTLQLSERPYVMSDYVETLLVTDHEVDPEVTTDLLENPYTFTVTKAETNDTRFTVSIKLKENQDTPTDIDIINGGGDLDGEKPIKFIYHDKMYILRNGVLYDATGKRVKEINK